MNISLRGQVVIAFRSNSYCFWEIWAVPGSIPRVGTWFFFFVQINYFKFFMYVCLSYNDKKQSNLSSNSLKITLNFWTVCVVYYYKSRVPIAFVFWILNNRLLHQKINFTIQVDNLEQVAFVQHFIEKWHSKKKKFSLESLTWNMPACSSFD